MEYKFTFNINWLPAALYECGPQPHGKNIFSIKITSECSIRFINMRHFKEETLDFVNTSMQYFLLLKALWYFIEPQLGLANNLIQTV